MSEWFVVPWECRSMIRDAFPDAGTTVLVDVEDLGF
jgi:hypothetical protein